MDLSNDLVYEFAKNTNDVDGQVNDSTVYGTIKIIDEEPYARLDGSDDLYTPVSTTTEVHDGDRVLIRIKNHTATVTGNTTDISVSQTTADGIEDSVVEIEKTANGIETKVSGIEGNYSKLQQTVNGFNTTVSNISGQYTTLQQTVNGFNTTVSDINGKYTTLQQTVDGFTFEDEDGTVKISGGAINLTGSITFSDLDSDAQTKINGATTAAADAANSAANAKTSWDNASAQANNAAIYSNNASSYANNALIQADSARAAAEEARRIASSIVVPTYLSGTYIDKATIMSPVIIGGKIYAVGQDANGGNIQLNSWTEMSALGLKVYTDGIEIPKIEMVTDNTNNRVNLFLGSGTYTGYDTDNVGRFRIEKRSDRTVLTYYSGEFPGLSANLVFGDNGCIIARRANSTTGETNAVTVLAGIYQEGANY